MKSIVLNEPGEAEFVDQPEPSYASGEALIRIRRIGICGTDYHAFQGSQPYFTYPRILGHELSGTIEAVTASNPQQFQVGDPVAILPYLQCGRCIACRQNRPNCCVNLQVLGVHRDGGMQEFLAVPLDHLVPTPDLSLEQAAILEPLSIGAHAVTRSGVAPDEFALVVGAGPIGLAAMAFAHRRGAQLLVIDTDPQRLAFAQTWCPGTTAIPAGDRPAEHLAEITRGDFPTVVFDATGNPQAMSRSVQYVAHGGRLVYVGLSQADIHIANPEFHKRELTLMSSRNATRDDFATAADAIREGVVRAESYVTQHIPFGEVAQEFQDLVDTQADGIKTLIEL